MTRIGENGFYTETNLEICPKCVKAAEMLVDSGFAPFADFEDNCQVFQFWKLEARLEGARAVAAEGGLGSREAAEDVIWLEKAVEIFKFVIEQADDFFEEVVEAIKGEKEMAEKAVEAAEVEVAEAAEESEEAEESLEEAVEAEEVEGTEEVVEAAEVEVAEAAEESEEAEEAVEVAGEAREENVKILGSSEVNEEAEKAVEAWEGKILELVKEVEETENKAKEARWGEREEVELSVEEAVKAGGIGRAKAKIQERKMRESGERIMKSLGDVKQMKKVAAFEAMEVREDILRFLEAKGKDLGTREFREVYRVFSYSLEFVPEYEVITVEGRKISEDYLRHRESRDKVEELMEAREREEAGLEAPESLEEPVEAAEVEVAEAAEEVEEAEESLEEVVEAAEAPEATEASKVEGEEEEVDELEQELREAKKLLEEAERKIMEVKRKLEEREKAKAEKAKEPEEDEGGESGEGEGGGEEPEGTEGTSQEDAEGREAPEEFVEPAEGTEEYWELKKRRFLMRFLGGRKNKLFIRVARLEESVRLNVVGCSEFSVAKYLFNFRKTFPRRDPRALPAFVEAKIKSWERSLRSGKRAGAKWTNPGSTEKILRKNWKGCTDEILRKEWRAPW